MKVLLEQANPDEKKQLTALVRSQLKDKNANWKAEHADLIASFQSLSELVKNDEALLEQVMDNVRKLGPEGDETFYEQLKSMLMGNEEQDQGKWEMQDQHQEKVLGTITESDLLNKPNMTAEDKEHMQDVLNFMKKKRQLRTDENLKKLYDNILYHED